jgi:hypothetical protein
MENVYSRIGKEFQNNMENQSDNPFINIKAMYEFYNLASRFMIESNGVKTLLNYPETFQFDLIMYDFTMGQSLLALTEHFGHPPMVAVTPFNIPSYTSYLNGDVELNPTYMPHFTTSFGPHMTFIDRIKNALYWSFDLFYRQRVFMPNENIRARKMLGRANVTDVRVIEKRTDLILVNCDFSFDFPVALPANVIPVGGLQTKRQEPLMKIAKEFMTRAKKGVVYLSFGTNLKTDAIREDIHMAILDIFSDITDYNFIWKIENPPFPRIPTNVLVLEWVQQNAVLANDRCKLFITHGGLLSIQEALWNGVPMIGLPFFADQHQNVKKLVHHGVGEKFDFRHFNKTAFKELIEKMLADPKYSENARTKSHQMRNQPIHPLDKAAFWIEKVIENRGLAYLKSPRLEMAFYQVYMLDIFGLILLVFIGYFVIVMRHVKSRKEKTE